MPWEAVWRGDPDVFTPRVRLLFSTLPVGSGFQSLQALSLRRDPVVHEHHLAVELLRGLHDDEALSGVVDVHSVPEREGPDIRSGEEAPRRVQAQLRTGHHADDTERAVRDEEDLVAAPPDLGDRTIADANFRIPSAARMTPRLFPSADEM